MNIPIMLHPGTFHQMLHRILEEVQQVTRQLNSRDPMAVARFEEMARFLLILAPVIGRHPLTSEEAGFMHETILMLKEMKMCIPDNGVLYADEIRECVRVLQEGDCVFVEQGGEVPSSVAGLVESVDMGLGVAVMNLFQFDLMTHRGFRHERAEVGISRILEFVEDIHMLDKIKEMAMEVKASS